MNKKRCLHSIAKYLRYISFCKVSPGLFYNGELTFSTAAGGLVTLCIAATVLSFFVINLMMTLNDKNYYADITVEDILAPTVLGGISFD